MGAFFNGQSHFVPYSQFVLKWTLYGIRYFIEIFCEINKKLIKNFSVKINS